MKTLLFTLILLLIGLNASFSQFNYVCTGQRFKDSIFSNAQIRRDSYLIYAFAKNDTGVLQSLVLNIHYPLSTADTFAKRPLVILIHGGGFITGSLNTMDFYCKEYAKMGYVAATISYRLGWNCPAADICTNCKGQPHRLYNAVYRASQDARAATRYLAVNAQKYRIDTGKIFIGGVSSGAIAALTAAYWTQKDADRYCGTNMKNTEGGLDTLGNSLIVSYTYKGVINGEGAIDSDTSLQGKTIPIISFHDELDCIVPFDTGRIYSCCTQNFISLVGSSIIHERLSKKEGVYSELHYVKNSIRHYSYPPIQVVKKSACFMHRVMCGEKGMSFSDTSVLSRPTCLKTGLNDLNNISNFIDIFPNPSTDILSIRINKSINYAFIQIKDITGRLILEKTIITDLTELIEWRNLKQGMYICDISLDGKRIIKKILKF
jgi:hypothetical protein